MTAPSDSDSKAGSGQQNPEASTGGVSRRNLIVGGAATAAVAGTTAEAATTQPPVYRIHPAIGFARVGNADPSTYFLGPEIPGQGTPDAPPYKVNGLVRPQGVRFRVFEYTWVGNRLTPTREVNLDTPGVTGIKWTVHLANKKSSFHCFEGRQGESSPAAPLRNAGVADRRSLEIDFGPRTVNGRAVTPVEFRRGTSSNPALESCPLGANGQPLIEYLGQLRTDAQGRLVVLGGKGVSASNTNPPAEMPHWANNDGWFDDASDGPVFASVLLSDGREVPVDPAGGAWVMVGPPDFAPKIRPSITLYDLLTDMAIRELEVPAENALYDDGGPLARLRQLKAAFRATGPEEFPGVLADYKTEIEPILRTAFEFRFVTSLVSSKHGTMTNDALGNPDPANDARRNKVFAYTRPPLGSTAPSGGQAVKGAGSMPKLLGDDPYIGSLPDSVKRLTLTRTQYGLMKRWNARQFVPPSSAPAPAATITPHGLDKAAAEAACGGAFFPGIEVGWQIRNPMLFIEPYRLDLSAMSGYQGETAKPVGPGHFSRQMAVPWQADFNDCRIEGNYGWWPSQRPDDVFLKPTDTRPVPWARATSRFSGGNLESTHGDMVALWYKFGFVVQSGGGFVEAERAATIP